VIVTVLSVRWLNGSLRQFWLWMPLAGLAAPVLFGVTLMLARR
jgi:hypothetical protein